jgi:hypothetical protein
MRDYRLASSSNRSCNDGDHTKRPWVVKEFAALAISLTYIIFRRESVTVMDSNLIGFVVLRMKGGREGPVDAVTIRFLFISEKAVP